MLFTKLYLWFAWHPPKTPSEWTNGTRSSQNVEHIQIFQVDHYEWEKEMLSSTSETWHWWKIEISRTEIRWICIDLHSRQFKSLPKRQLNLSLHISIYEGPLYYTIHSQVLNILHTVELSLPHPPIFSCNVVLVTWLYLHFLPYSVRYSTIPETTIVLDHRIRNIAKIWIKLRDVGKPIVSICFFVFSVCVQGYFCGVMCNSIEKKKKRLNLATLNKIPRPRQEPGSLPYSDQLVIAVFLIFPEYFIKSVHIFFVYKC